MVVVQEASSSPLPLEHLSEYAVNRFLEALPSSRARFFERHITSAGELWFEVVREGRVFRREPAAAAAVAAGLAR